MLPSVVRLAVIACCLATASERAVAQSAAGSAAEWRDSTVVLLVPTGVETAAPGLARLCDALGAARVVAVYSAGDAATLRAARRLQDVVGGDLRPYDRGGLSASGFAVRLADNAVGSNRGAAVVVVVEPEFVKPFLRRAMAIAGRPATEAVADIGPGEALLLTLAPDRSRVSRVALGGTDDGPFCHSGSQ